VFGCHHARIVTLEHVSHTFSWVFSRQIGRTRGDRAVGPVLVD
jgi:hypothetical protein